MKDMSILFSGGPDSTLAVLRALDECDRVHLLTYHHGLMNMVGKHVKVTEELKSLYGEERIVIHEEAIGGLYKKCYFARMRRYLPRYRTYYVPWLCGACKMAMHIKTIEYNRNNNVEITYDGANSESKSYFPAQTKEYIDVMKDFYGSYGMRYDCPIYEVCGTDDETTKYGLSSTGNTKKEHVFFSTQHTCFVGLVIHAHSRLYYRPFRGKNRMRGFAGQFLKQMIDDNPELLPSG